jgi:hypothetical protein
VRDDASETYTSDDGALEVRLHRPLAGEYIELDLWERVSCQRYYEPVDAKLRSRLAQSLIEARRPQPVEQPRPEGGDDATGTAEVLEGYVNADGSLRVDVTANDRRTSFDLVDVDCSLILYSVEVDGQPDATQRRQMVQRMIYNERPTRPRIASDARALALIAAYLRVADLDAPDFRQEVERLIAWTGRDTATPGDEELWGP